MSVVMSLLPGGICLLKLVPVYTKAVKDYALELGLICNISYEKNG